jgi:predicted nucleic acid-binding protein
VNYLLDTNVVSEIRKPEADENVRAWLAATRSDDLYLSVLTVGEIRRGIERLRRRDGAQADILDAWLATLRRDFAPRIVPISVDITDEWGRLGVPDRFPLSTACWPRPLEWGNLTLVTRNTADLARTGARLLDPFEPAG